MDTTHRTAWVDLCWRLIPLETPCIVRRCAHCNAPRRFASTGKFRLNAQQRRLDVWLLYRCVACEATWKHPVFERCAPEDIGDDLYARLLRNDPETARTYAFDVAALRNGGGQVDEGVPFRVEASPLASACAAGGWRITLDLSLPCSVRLDRLLVHMLGVSRTQVRRWATDGKLIVPPEDRRALSRSVRHGQILLIHSDGLAKSVS